MTPFDGEVLNALRLLEGGASAAELLTGLTAEDIADLGGES